MIINPGSRIKELRTLADMSQEELGRRIGVQRAAVNKYEKGAVTNIPIQTVERIAQVFDVSPTYILGWDDSNTNPLAMETKVIQGVKQFFGSESVEMLEFFMELNNKGKKRAIEHIIDLSKIDEYQQ